MKKYRIVNQYGAVVMVEGKPQVFNTNEEAEEALQRFVSLGITHLDIEGFMER